MYNNEYSGGAVTLTLILGRRLMWVISWIPWSLYVQENISWYSSIPVSGRNRGVVGASDKKISFLRWESSHDPSVVYTDYVSPAPHCQSSRYKLISVLQNTLTCIYIHSTNVLAWLSTKAPYRPHAITYNSGKYKGIPITNLGTALGFSMSIWELPVGSPYPSFE
jgi:hypothetical protein